MLTNRRLNVKRILVLVLSLVLAAGCGGAALAENTTDAFELLGIDLMEILRDQVREEMEAAGYSEDDYEIVVSEQGDLDIVIKEDAAPVPTPTPVPEENQAEEMSKQAAAYAAGVAKEATGDWFEAVKMYVASEGFADSAERIKPHLEAYVTKQMEAGEYHEAQKALLLCGDPSMDPLLAQCNDKCFLLDMADGLEKRWESSTVSADYGDLVLFELDFIEKYMDADFADETLKQYAQTYISGLHDQLTGYSYQTVNAEKYDEYWTRGLNTRAHMIYLIHEQYGIDVSEAQKGELRKMALKGKAVAETSLSPVQESAKAEATAAPTPEAPKATAEPKKTENAKTYPALKNGSKGEAVVALQTRLLELGFYSSSIDGSFGNRTSTAIKAFEKYNGLTVSGVASPELQQFLFSEEARGVEVPDIEITDIGLKKSYSYYFLYPTFVNHTTDTIQSITYRLKAYNTAGERLGSSGPLDGDDIRSYDGSDCYNLERVTGEIAKLSVKPGASVTIKKNNRIDLYCFDEDSMNIVYLTVVRYVTTDGKIVEIPENEQTWYGSDGSIETIEYENKLLPRQEVTFEMEEKADEIDLGMNVYYIANFFAEVIDLPVGGLQISYVSYNSAAEAAGLKENDIIVKIGDVWTYDEDSLIAAKAAVDPFEPTTVVYYRRGRMVETDIIFD